MPDDLLKSLRVPAFCPVCKTVMRGSFSTRTYYDWGCCSSCHIEFVEDREERWRGGWRPSEEQVEQYIARLSRDA